MENTPKAIDEVRALAETVSAWRDELARAQAVREEVRDIVDGLRGDFEKVRQLAAQAHQGDLRPAVLRIDAKLDTVIAFIAAISREDKEALGRFQQIATDALATGDISAGRDVNVKKG